VSSRTKAREKLARLLPDEFDELEWPKFQTPGKLHDDCAVGQENLMFYNLKIVLKSRLSIFKFLIDILKLIIDLFILTISEFYTMIKVKSSLSLLVHLAAHLLIFVL